MKHIDEERIQAEITRWILGRVEYEDLPEDILNIIRALLSEFGHTLSLVQIRDFLRILSAPTEKAEILRDAIQDVAQVRARETEGVQGEPDLDDLARGVADWVDILAQCRDNGEPIGTAHENLKDSLVALVRHAAWRAAQADAWRHAEGTSDERIDERIEEATILRPCRYCRGRGVEPDPGVQGEPDDDEDQPTSPAPLNEHGAAVPPSDVRPGVQENPGAITVSADCPRCGESVEVAKFESGGTDVFSVNPSGEAQREPDDGLLQIAVSRVTESVERMARAVVSEGKGALDDATEELYRDLLDLVRQHARDGGRR